MSLKVDHTWNVSSKLDINPATVVWNEEKNIQPDLLLTIDSDIR